MDVHSITLFGVALAGKTTPLLQKQCTELAAKIGYAVHPDACTEETLQWLQSQQANFNSTFYQKWQDVASKSRTELLIDQLLHYASTYGTGHTQEGNGYVPNQGAQDVPDLAIYKVISPISETELAYRCIQLGSSGINLSTEVVAFCANIIHAVIAAEDARTVIETLTSRELKAALYDRFNLSPLEKFDLLRYICSKQLGQPMIIQNKEQIYAIKNNTTKFDFTTLTEEQVKNLSSIFLRYKNWLLAFKNEKNAPVLNKMRRLAKKTHTPLKPGFWETLLDKKPSIETVQSRLKEISAFKKVQLYMACKERLLQFPYRAFLVRNQKLYWKQNNLTSDVQYFKDLMYHIGMSICPGKKVRLPKNFRLACPSSEKSFIGNLPLGTAYKFADEDAFMGIYWRGEWGTQDFDLHFFDTRGQHIGWNSQFKNEEQSVMFSGDMTSANPEATELMYMANGCPEGFLSVDRYNGAQGSRFDIILGSEEITDMKLNYMVDPNNIHLRVECTSDTREQTCAYVKDNQFVLMSFKTGNQQVPDNPALINILAQKSECFLYLDEVCEVVPDDYEGDDFVDLSGDLAKDDIINLLSSDREK